MNNSIRICNLGSSSSGNSTLIRHGNRSLLVDMGFSQRYMRQALDENGLRTQDVGGVLITHLHGDHVTRAMVNLMLRLEVPLYMHRNLRTPFLNRFKPKIRKGLHFVENQPFELAGFTIGTFPVHHDSVGGCYGYRIEKAGRKISLATDLGFPRNGLARHFANSDVIIIESNHDPDMLENSGRPRDLIDRIQQIGHLSNGQSSDFIQQILQISDKVPQTIALAHLSDECNRPQLARENMQQMLDAGSYAHTTVHIFKKNALTDEIYLALD